ncbi:hypothetical protein C2E23DRAFT_354501 [Lenzites betulinus]|nr:hypothetical protein C2E23DRAFT_354501 [Lenzites betulinus]
MRSSPRRPCPALATVRGGGSPGGAFSPPPFLGHSNADSAGTHPPLLPTRSPACPPRSSRSLAHPRTETRAQNENENANPRRSSGSRTQDGQRRMRSFYVWAGPRSARRDGENALAAPPTGPGAPRARARTPSTRPECGRSAAASASASVAPPAHVSANASANAISARPSPHPHPHANTNWDPNRLGLRSGEGRGWASLAQLSLD